jgi:CMP-N-acetylneuraminic acid synthetase
MGNVVAVIPARGRSKGLPGKNILPLLGKPVLAYTADAAQHARTLDRIILSTDSEEIAQVGRQCGLEVPFLRPDNLSTDTAHPTAVLEHALSFLEETEGYSADVVVTLQPTSPLRKAVDIDSTVDLLLGQDNLDSVITVEEVHIPPFWMFREQDGLLKSFVDDGINYSLMRRQELDQVYQQNGAVYATRRWLLGDQKIIFSAYNGGNTGYVPMDAISSLQIDTPADFQIIEAVLREQAQK